MQEKITPRTRSYASAASGFAEGKGSPRDFLEQCLEDIDAHEDRIGAFVALDVEAARAEADSSSRRWQEGRTLSSIDGMPIGIKDVRETAVMVTEQGSPLFKGWVGGRDCAAVVALREAGAVILGKTVTTEFAATEPRGTRNPWDLERTPGGVVERVGSVGRSRHGTGCAGFAGDWLHHPPGKLLRGVRLQAQRRRDKPGRQFRRFQPELHGEQSLRRSTNSG